PSVSHLFSPLVSRLFFRLWLPPPGGPASAIILQFPWYWSSQLILLVRFQISCSMRPAGNAGKSARSSSGRAASYLDSVCRVSGWPAPFLNDTALSHPAFVLLMPPSPSGSPWRRGFHFFPVRQPAGPTLYSS